MIKIVRQSVISDTELKRLARLAEDGFVATWVADARESLENAAKDALELQSQLEELKNALAVETLNSKTRSRTALVLKELIAFNNACEKDYEAFKHVGSTHENADIHIEKIKKVLRQINS